MSEIAWFGVVIGLLLLVGALRIVADSMWLRSFRVDDDEVRRLEENRRPAETANPPRYRARAA
jgi:hypothetical protein